MTQHPHDATTDGDRRAADEVAIAVTTIHHERRQGWNTPAEIDKRFADGSERMARIETKLDVNSVKTDATAKGVEEVLDILNLAKSFFRILGIIGSVTKWVALVAAPVLALVYTVKGGHK